MTENANLQHGWLELDFKDAAERINEWAGKFDVASTAVGELKVASLKAPSKFEDA